MPSADSSLSARDLFPIQTGSWKILSLGPQSAHLTVRARGKLADLKNRDHSLEVGNDLDGGRD